MIKLKANNQDGTFLKGNQRVQMKRSWMHSICLPNIPYLSLISCQTCTLTLIDKKAFYDIHNRKDWDSTCLQQMSLIPPMLHFLLFHFVKHHHSPPQVLSDCTVIRKYKRQGHGAHEVIPGTQKRRTALAKIERQHRRNLDFQGLPEQSAHRSENTCLSLSCRCSNWTAKAQVSVTSA